MKLEKKINTKSKISKGLEFRDRYLTFFLSKLERAEEEGLLMYQYTFSKCKADVSMYLRELLI